MSTVQTAPPLAAGTRLDAFEIAGVLEQGRYSITYLGRDAAGSEVVIKEFLPQEFALREDGVVKARETPKTARRCASGCAASSKRRCCCRSSTTPG